MIPVLILGALGLVGAAAYVTTRKPKGEMTPERETIFSTAMNSTVSPGELRTLAAAFEAQGLPEQAEALRKRAVLRELNVSDPALAQARKEAYQKGMSSQNPAEILKLAEAFESEGAIGAASSLRKYAQKLALSQERTQTAA